MCDDVDSGINFLHGWVFALVATFCASLRQ